MIHLTKGNTETICLTLSEKQTIVNVTYLFRFVNRTTKQEVVFTLYKSADLSTYKDRYNKFSFKTNKYFQYAEPGEWTYLVYEQSSTSNTDYTQSGALLEEGIMRLSEATAFSYTEYGSDNTYITR